MKQLERFQTRRTQTHPMGSTNPESLSPVRSQQLSQARYERALLTEITKLQDAIVDERNIVTAQKRAMATAVAAEKERRASEADKSSRLQAMEKAIEEAQRAEQKVFNRKRAVAEKRMKEAAKQAEKDRKQNQLRKEAERQAAQKAHEEQLAQATEERRQAEALRVQKCACNEPLVVVPASARAADASRPSLSDGALRPSAAAAPRGRAGRCVFYGGGDPPVVGSPWQPRQPTGSPALRPSSQTRSKLLQQFQS